MIHHDASMRRTNTQRSSNNNRRNLKEDLPSLRDNILLPVRSNAFASRRTFSSSRPPPCLLREGLPAMGRSMALRRAHHSTVQREVHQRNLCSTLPICSRPQMCRDSKKGHNTNSMAVQVRCMAWASNRSRRRNRHTIRFRATLSDLAPRLRHWRPNLGFRRLNTILQASRFRQVQPRPNWRRRTYRRNISNLHTLQLDLLHHRRHTAIQ